MTPQVEKLNIKAVKFFSREPSSSLSPIKSNPGDNSSTPIKGGSPKQSRLMEVAWLEALTSFFLLPSILPSRVPNTLKKFVIVATCEDLSFVQSLTIAERRAPFIDTSCILFRVRFLVSMIAYI